MHGVPVVCQNRSGMADMVADECGVKVSSSSPDALVNGFASALSAYYTNPSLVRRHGEAGQLRVHQEYTWIKCGNSLDNVYSKVLYG